MSGGFAVFQLLLGGMWLILEEWSCFDMGVCHLLCTSVPFAYYFSLLWIVSWFFFGWITFGRWACVFLVVCVSSFPFVVICGSRFPLRPARLHYWGCFWNFSHSCRVGTFETLLFVERWVSNSRNFVQLYQPCERNAHLHPNFFSIKAFEAYDRICLGIPFGNEPFGNEACCTQWWLPQGFTLTV